MDREELRHQSYEAWERMAGGWEMAVDRIEASATPVREWLLRELAPRRGDVVLELAAGPGETGFAAAAAVGEQGRVISSDRSPAMVDVGGGVPSSSVCGTSSTWCWTQRISIFQMRW
jgi:hypothetical protein